MLPENQSLSQEYLDYLKSDHWWELKQRAFVSYGHKCLYCGYWRNIHVHHLRYPRPLESATVKDVIPLCGICHKEHHKRIKKFTKLLGREKAVQNTIYHLKNSKRAKDMNDFMERERRKISNESKARHTIAKKPYQKKWLSKLEQFQNDHQRKLDKS